jgi:hypothetical protein
MDESIFTFRGYSHVMVKTNELKKGVMVTLRNGWKARIEDNKKGNTRICTVYGFETEMGSVYAHDIVLAEIDGFIHFVEHTPKQLKLRERVMSMGV